uniref:Uncharacterized protein n=1 Tax=Arundo donax TaxID=35708 RepID=A0A0A8ZSK3_ARUDO
MLRLTPIVAKPILPILSPDPWPPIALRLCVRGMPLKSSQKRTCSISDEAALAVAS